MINDRWVSAKKKYAVEFTHANPRCLVSGDACNQ